tara:strand:+ start:165 stop:431 length:267 start_codon:yes stop_codon:yes gene_type:complete
MILNKNTLQNLFLIILTITVSLNASINPIMVQISSISFIIFFLFCLKNVEILERIRKNYVNNKIFFYLIFYLCKLFNNTNNSTSIKFN